jgi:hypothetical protein
VPSWFAVSFPQSPEVLMQGTLVSFGLYLGFYWYMAHAARVRRRRATRPAVRSVDLADVETETASLQA